MICKTCGHELPQGELVCPICGWDSMAEVAKQAEAAVDSVTEQTQETVVVTETPNSVQYDTQTAPNTEVFSEPEQKKDSADKCAIASLICGIASFFCCGIAGIAGIIVGIFGIKSKTNKNLAIAGIAVSSAAVVIKLIAVIVIIISAIVSTVSGISTEWYTNFGY